jgi:NACHT domain
MTQFDQRYQQVETQYNADQITIQPPPLSLTQKQQKQNHTRMLQRVQAIWIDGVLEPSLQGAAQIALELQKKPSAIVTPLWHVLREFDTTGQLTSENASIEQVYDHASGEVLILGEPGSGKTTLLLELTRTLLERAGQDEAHPIPVVFPLSSWATKREPLTIWLASELHTRYQVPLPLATYWIETDQVLPLLDGLDEVAAPHRAACVEAINTYRQAHGLLPTVVCSRQADYFALSTRLLLRTAVVVQPLTPEQIESYLTSGGQRLEALRQTLRKDADLRALTSTPLMLNVLTVASQATSLQQITTTSSLGRKQERVFASYVQRMLTRRSTSRRYTPEQTTHWLRSLAAQMKRQSQTIFYLEQMQPTWLSDHRMLEAYDWLAVRLPGVLMGILVSLTINGFFLNAGAGRFGFSELFSFLSSILLGGLLGGLLSEGSTPHQPAVSGGKAESALGPRFLQWLLIGTLTGLGVGLSAGLSGGPSYGLSFGLSAGLSFGLSAGLCSVLLQFLLQKKNMAEARSPTPPPAKGTIWQRLIRRREIRNGLLVGLSSGLSFGLSYGLSSGLSFGLSLGLYYGLSYGLLIGLSYGLIGGLLSVLLIGRSITVQLADRLIWSPRSLGRSLLSKRHVSATLRVTGLIGLLVGLLYGLLGGLSYGLSSGLSYGLLFGLLAGLSFWLLFGLFQGVSSVTIEDQRRMVPNQGIRRSALNGLVLGLISAVIVGLLSWLSARLSLGLLVGLLYGLPAVLRDGLLAGLSYGLSLGLHAGQRYGLSVGLSNGLLAGLSAGLLAGLLNGGLAWMRHYVLRFLLWRSGALPWHYPRFLDNAAEQILLRKVGGGYIFLHRLLLDYFADLEISSDSQVFAEGRQEILPLGILPSTSAEPSEVDSYVDAPTSQLISTSIPSEVPCLLPCGHEQRTLNARFCSVCGQPVQSSSLD